MVRGEDFDRPLSDQGVSDMVRLAEKMTAVGLRPEYCHCSPARRTRDTLSTLISGGLGDLPTDFPDNQYNAPAGTLYETLKQTDDKHQSVMMVAHNPGIHNLAVFLIRREDAAPLSMGYQAGTLTVLDVECDRWEDVMPNSSTLRTFMPPAS